MFSYMNYYYTFFLIISFQYGMTPLHYASEYGHSEVVQVLLSHGATVDILSHGATVDMRSV